jgi:hypothetical protein
MRVHLIVCAAIYVVTGAGCSGELAERPPANDPGSVTAAEAPYRRPPSYERDPLLSPAPPTGAEPPPTGKEQVHSPTATPPGNPPMREEPGGRVPAHPHDHGSMPGMQREPRGDGGAEPAPTTIYTCPMHPEVQQREPGKCPKCGMTLVPSASKGGGQ